MNEWAAEYEKLKVLLQYGYEFDVTERYRPVPSKKTTAMTGREFYNWFARNYREKVQSITFPTINVRKMGNQYEYELKIPSDKSLGGFVFTTKYGADKVIETVAENEIFKRYHDVNTRIGDTTLGDALDL